MALDFSLSDDQRILRETMLKVLDPFESRREELWRQIHVEKDFPQELWDAICDTGLLGAMVPEEYGGNGMGLLATALGVEAVATRGFGNALLILTAMDAGCIARAGSEEIKQRYLPRMATGELKFCFAITEPDAGTNAFRMTTLARREGDDYLIRGQKVFITGADVADRMLLVCRTTSAEEVAKQGLPKSHGLAVFVVDPRAEGVELRPIPTRGIEGMNQFMVHLDDVRVPASDLVGEPDAGAKVMFTTLNPERILASAMACGLTEYVLGIAVRYANERRVFDKPIGAHQAVSHPLAKVRIDLEAARLLTYQAAWAFDRPEIPPGQVGTYANMAKYKAAETVIEAVDRGIQTLGGYGFSDEYGLIHLHDNVRLLRTAPITAEMILNFLAEHELGLPRSY